MDILNLGTLITFVVGFGAGCVIQAFGAAKVHGEIQKATLEVMGAYHDKIVGLETELARLRSLV